MPPYILLSIIGIFHHFPEHPFWVLEQIFVFNEVEVHFIIFIFVSLIFRYFYVGVRATIFVLMVYPPIPILAIGQFGDQVLGFVAAEFHVQVTSDDVRVGGGGVLHGHHVFQVVVE